MVRRACPRGAILGVVSQVTPCLHPRRFETRQALFSSTIANIRTGTAYTRVTYQGPCTRTMVSKPFIVTRTVHRTAHNTFANTSQIRPDIWVASWSEVRRQKLGPHALAEWTVLRRHITAEGAQHMMYEDTARRKRSRKHDVGRQQMIKLLLVGIYTAETRGRRGSSHRLEDVNTTTQAMTHHRRRNACPSYNASDIFHAHFQRRQTVADLVQLSPRRN